MAPPFPPAAVGVAAVVLAALPRASAHSAFLSLIPNSVNVGGVAALGHENGKGGGPLTSFGRDFLANGKTWDVALCVRDSDGDGQYNGLELGDPCCEWDGSAPPPVVQRNFSHPGDAASKVEGTAYRSTPYDDRWRELVLAADRKERRRLVNMRGVSCDPIPPPAEVVPAAAASAGAAGSAEKGIVAQVPAWLGTLMHPYAQKWLVTQASWLGYVGVAFQRRREIAAMWRRGLSAAGGGGATAAATPHAAAGFGVSALDLAVVVCLATFYTEVASATMHLVADNEAFSDLPLFGPIAKSFQWHHRDPTGIVRLTWISHLGALDMGMLLLMALALCNPRAWYLGIFALATHPLMYLMMATHRWTHCSPGDVPGIVALLQRRGVLLTPAGHSAHHADYEINFSLLTGWSNPVVNALARGLGVRAHAWLYVFVGWVAAVPLALAAMGPKVAAACPKVAAREV
mmetsp:Transcript_85633/g.242849  ORF Transcript_85633/g.242849 Transcript_85633/m.242849 type:complete len:459 (+) Transcript_85633:70-1446(+)